MLKKRSITIRGHRTSFSIEDAFYSELVRLAEMQGKSLAWLITRIDAAREPGQSLSSSLRLHVLESMRKPEQTGSQNASSSGPGKT